MTDSPFSPDALKSAVHATLAQAYAAIPAGATHAVILDANYNNADGPAGRIVFAQKVEHGWQIAGSLGYDKPHGVTAGAEVLRSW